jgi:tRNA (Thr-GGU) A37 N-methylase
VGAVGHEGPRRCAETARRRAQSWIRFDDQVTEGAKDLRPGDEIIVLPWLHLSPRDELRTHPEHDMSQPLTGMFSTCSPNQPNPIGLHRALIVARDGLRIEVDALEAIDRTPVVDVKPATDPPADGPHVAVLPGHLPAQRTVRPGR